MLRIKTCPSCGSQSIRKVKKDLVGRIGDEAYIVPKLQFYDCPECGEKVYDREAMRKIEAHSPAYQASRA